ncbi:MAG: glucose-1-phosphate adenylyltransferase subunit GlgD [Oscillospiraceae bacterium]
MNDLHGIIFAYRSNADLRQLTQHRNTCSIPFLGRYRLVDFMLSSMVNAGVSDVGMVVHSGYQSLLDHVGSGKDWDLSRKHGGLKILPPFGYADRVGSNEYQGRMDALAGVRSYLDRIHQEYVILAGGDTVANLPLNDVYEQHLKTGADITAVCTTKPTGDPRSSTYFTVGADGFVSDVAVCPTDAIGCESLEVYVLSKALLLSLVDYCAAHRIFSFSEGVLQAMSGTLKIHPYLFDGYAARFHSLGTYFARSMELLDPVTRNALFDPARPIKTKDRSNPSTYYGPESVSKNSLIADGCIIGGTVENSILSRGVQVAPGAVVSNCILMQGTKVGAGATLKYAIADKNVEVNSGRMLMGHGSYPIAIEKDTVV